jgi:osmotically-inducible protein OsmY
MKQNNISKKFLFLTGLAIAMLSLSGCGVAVGAGAAVGVAAAKEGGLQNSLTDESIRLRISDLWFRRSIDIFRKLDLTVNQGRVLITGVVQRPEDRVEAVRLAWQAQGVKQVINEIQVGNSGGISVFASDKWISAQLRTAMIRHSQVQSINYSIDTVKGIVYLMGVAQNQAELNRVIRLARQIKGVKEVVSYVKLAGEAVPSQAQNNSLSPPTQLSNSVSAAPAQTSQPSFQSPPQAGSLIQSDKIEKEILPP